MNKYAYLLTGVVVGLVCGFGLGRVARLQASHQIDDTRVGVSLGDRIRVVAAVKDLPAGTRLDSSSLAVLPVFAAAAPDAIPVSDLKEVLGKKTLAAVRAKEPLLWSLVDMRSPANDAQEE